MKQWIITLFPEQYRTSKLYWIGFFWALVIVAALILQLFHFEQMPAVAFDVYGSYEPLALYSLIAVQLGALPALVGMHVSRWMYKISLRCISLTGVVWFALALLGMGLEAGSPYIVLGPSGLAVLSWATVTAASVAMVMLIAVSVLVAFIHGYPVGAKMTKLLEKL